MLINSVLPHQKYLGCQISALAQPFPPHCTPNHRLSHPLVNCTLRCCCRLGVACSLVSTLVAEAIALLAYVDAIKDHVWSRLPASSGVSVDTLIACEPMYTYSVPGDLGMSWIAVRAVEGYVKWLLPWKIMTNKRNIVGPISEVELRQSQRKTGGWPIKAPWYMAPAFSLSTPIIATFHKNPPGLGR